MPSRLVASKRLGELFKVLSHPDRIRLVEELRFQELDVHGLAERLELADPRVSQHLALLRSQGVVEERREGRHVFYHLCDEGIGGWILDGLKFLEQRYGHELSDLMAAREAQILWSEKASTRRHSR